MGDDVVEDFVWKREKPFRHTLLDLRLPSHIERCGKVEVRCRERHQAGCGVVVLSLFGNANLSPNNFSLLFLDM